MITEEKLKKMQKVLTKGTAGLLIVGIVGLYGIAGINVVDPGEVGVVVKYYGENKGMQDYTFDSGLYWREPFKYDVILYDVKSKQYELKDVRAGTKDGQPISVDVSFEIALSDSGVPNLHETVGKNYFDEVVYPAARATIRTATSNQLSDEVYTGDGRTKIQEELNEKLQTRLKSRGIRIQANLRDISFQNADFVATLERKAKADQEEEIQRRLAAAAREEAQKVKATAEGERYKREQAAQANAYELQKEGEGQRQKQEEIAKGILAVGLAEAEVTKEKRAALAGPGGQEMVAIAWAENLGPNVKVYGFPTGAPGTNSIIDVNSVIQGALKK